MAGESVASYAYRIMFVTLAKDELVPNMANAANIYRDDQLTADYSTLPMKVNLLQSMLLNADQTTQCTVNNK